MHAFDLLACLIVLPFDQPLAAMLVDFAIFGLHAMHVALRDIFIKDPRVRLV